MGRGRPPALSDWEDAEVVIERDGGWTWEQIGLHHGVDKKTAQRALRAARPQGPASEGK